jgi:hypothetical protein
MGGEDAEGGEVGEGDGEAGGEEMGEGGGGEAREGVRVAVGMVVMATGVVEGGGVGRQAVKMSRKEIKISVFSLIQGEDS